jgi:hypothetical protein
MIDNHITVNGVPLELHLKQNTQPKAKLAPTEEELLRRAAKSHIVTSHIRNHSGSRSGRGRIIMQAGVML